MAWEKKKCHVNNRMGKRRDRPFLEGRERGVAAVGGTNKGQLIPSAGRPAKVKREVGGVPRSKKNLNRACKGLVGAQKKNRLMQGNGGDRHNEKRKGGSLTLLKQRAPERT